MFNFLNYNLELMISIYILNIILNMPSNLWSDKSYQITSKIEANDKRYDTIWCMICNL